MHFQVKVTLDPAKEFVRESCIVLISLLVLSLQKIGQKRKERHAHR
jgi:hypothetical protein